MEPNGPRQPRRSVPILALVRLEVREMKALLWIGLLMCLVGTGMLVADIGPRGIWAALITVGIVLVRVSGHVGQGRSAQG